MQYLCEKILPIRGFGLGYGYGYGYFFGYGYEYDELLLPAMVVTGVKLEGVVLNAVLV